VLEPADAHAFSRARRSFARAVAAATSSLSTKSALTSAQKIPAIARKPTTRPE
jgi:hypothetical protein